MRLQILIFPTTSVANNFYSELRNPLFPNRYDNYLQTLARSNKLGQHQLDSRKALELKGELNRASLGGV